MRVRLLGHPGLPRAARRGLPGHPRQLEPGDDHDRPGVRRRDLRRAARRRHPHPDHRARTPGRRAADARRTNGAQPRDATRRARRGRGRRRYARADRRQRGSNRHRRRPRAVQGRDAGNRPCRAVVGDRAHPRRGARRRRTHRTAGDHPARFHPRREGHRHRIDHRRARTGRAHRARRQSDQRDPHRALDRRLEGVRARGHARSGGQLRRHLLDREPRPDGRAHRRLHHGRAGADA